MTFVEDLAEAMNPTGRSREHRPCALGGRHTEPRPQSWNPARTTVYCEHGLSDWACPPCRGDPPAMEPEKCEICGVPKSEHTEREAALCVTRVIAGTTDKPVHLTGP